MNAKPLWTGAAMLALAALALACPAPALAGDPSRFLADPLQTMPEAVEAGVILPGDSAPIPTALHKDFSLPLTLAEAVDLALCNNPRIKSAWADIKIQAGAAGEARAAYLPALNASLNRTSDHIRYADSRTPESDVERNTAQVSATWRIFDFGGRAANRQAAESMLAAALAGHDAVLQQALASVIQAYFEAITSHAEFRTKTENEALAASILESAQAREAKGAVSQSDTLRAKTALAKARLEKNRALGGYRKALAVLGQLLGLPGNTAILLPDDLDEHSGEEGKELSRWLEEARAGHPAIVAAQNQLQAAQQRVAVARSAGLPFLNLTGNYYQNTRPGEAVTSVEAKESTVGIALSIPIFDGFSSTYKIRGAQAQVEQKKAALAETEQQVAMEIVKAHADALSALENLEASALLLDAAHNALLVSRRKYDKGAADITEILGTQAALADARQERVRSLAEWHAARLRLLAGAGRMGRFAVNN